MPLEIERKFLVISTDFKYEATSVTEINQGYISTHPERAVRIRIQGNKGFITIKGMTNESGLSRYEWENEISLADASELLKICEPGVIEKVRYEVKYNGLTYEVDEYLGNNKGLIIAELELATENDEFLKPEWIGNEVTGVKKYYNSMLILHPFSKW